MYDAILVPTDGSDHAARAARHAFGLADRFDATVYVLAVVDVAAAAGPFDAGGVSEEFVDRLKADAREWTDAVEALAGPAVAVEAATTRGRPGEEILAYARNHDVDLLAMGTRGRSGLRRYLAGSATEHVVRRSAVPVLTARAGEGEPRLGYDDVLVPTDGSDCADAAVTHALAIAAAYDATVHALNVVDTTVVAAQPQAVPGTPLLDQLESQGQDATEAVADRARARGLSVEATVQRGLPGQTLLEYVEERGIDLVAMGTHGRSGFGRLVLGSTTERVFRQAPVPVVAVRAIPSR